MIQVKLKEYKENTVRKQDRIYNSQGNTVNNGAIHSFVQIKQEDDSIEVKVECNSEPENECKETIFTSNPEYKQLYEHHIVKDELVIGPVVIQETCTNIDCLPKDEAEYDQCMSEVKNYRQRTKQRKHNIKTKMRSDTVCSINRNKATKLEKQRKCNFCNKLYLSNNIQRHIKYHCSLNQNKTFNPNQMKDVVCNLCNKVFSSKDSRNNHIKYSCAVNTDKKSFICHTCNKSYQTKACLSAHIMFKHSTTMNLVKYQCEHCGKEYNRKDSLVFHMKEKHTKKYYNNGDCHHCNKVFSNRKYLNHHIKFYCPMNKNKRPASVCKLCKKVFVSLSVLRKHLKNSCSMNQYRTIYKCDTCNKSYRRNVSLTRHIMSKHSNTMNLVKYQCDYCKKEFSRKDSVLFHIQEKHLL